ncbi:MAG TPA: lysophospholipid acyltransferase family protein [Xanthobacteraceae bacterium]|nr:lysophospholipid acyltransferase family protein [Xanthobacteraceae bacterium]
MQLWRHIGRQRWAKVTIGVAAAEYLRFVGMTTRFTLEPVDAYERGEADMPIIVAFWHGQHLLAPVGRKVTHRVKMLVSRHHDGEINAIAAERLGVDTIRGSGNHRGGFVHKAGVAAFQAMLDALADGCSIALSADVPKVARVAGLGIIKLAQASGRPIYPGAIATRRRIVLNNWDRTTINLPFGRGAGVTAEPLSVAPDADQTALEAARRLLEERLNAATRRAYELVDQPHIKPHLGD